MRECKNVMLAMIVSLGIAAGPASADVMLGFQPVGNSAGGAALSSFVTTDLMLTTQGDWLGSNLLIQLTSGSIYQDQYGSNTPPNSGLVAAFPSLAFDTYVEGPGGAAASSAGFADLGGYHVGTSAQFDTAGINYNWYDTANTGAGTFATGRFSISDDAVGTWAFYTEDASSMGHGLQLSGTIQNGTFAVPEPGTLALLGLGLVSLLAYAWRKRN